MLIQPYTINAVAAIILTGILFVALQVLSKGPQSIHGRATVWLTRAIGWGFLHLLFLTAVKISTNPWIKLGQYFQTTGLFLTYFCITRFFYGLREAFVPGPHRETKIYTHVFQAALLWELAYLTWRFWMYTRQGAVPARPSMLELPSLLLVIWTLITLLRTWMTAQKSVQQVPTGWKDALQSFLSPKHPMARFLRGFLFVIGGLFLYLLSFIFLPPENTPTLLPIVFDTILMVSIVSLVFLYLQMQSLPVTLETRILGAGLTLFLALTYMLAWIQTAVYFQQALPGVPVLKVVGLPSEYNYITPAAYQAAAADLHKLLLPLVGFEIFGGTLFTLAFIIFYRTTLRPSLHQILQGIDRIEHGNLDEPIPVLWQDEFGRVAVAINALSVGLKNAYTALLEYQHTLEDKIQERTFQLEREHDRRKILEIEQAIQDERQRIAEETHDGLLQSLMGMGIRLRRGAKLSQKDAASIEAELRDLEAENQKSVQELRQLINNLHVDIAREGLAASIQSAVLTLEQAYDIRIEMNINYTPSSLTVTQELDILRIAQEGLSNACKHSQSAQVSFNMQPDSKGTFLLINIEDTGVGFDPELNYTLENHWGIQNIQNRADRLNADLKIISRGDIGTKLFIKVPLE